jgi:hypothetical protein
MTPMYLLTAALIIAGWLVMFIGLQWMVKRTGAELRLEFQRQIETLSAKVKNLEEAASAPTAVLAPGKWEASAAPGVAQAHLPAPQVSEAITPEILAKLADTITALLGRKVRIRSVKILETPDASPNPWAQHGRAVIQASRNFASRRREL